MPPKSVYKPMVGWVYDLLLWFLALLVDLFFREVHPRGSWKVPKRGPVILVAAPHANQFVDSLILMRVLRMERHRRIAFLIAQKSFTRKFVGTLARAAGSVPVSRAMDSIKPGQGTIYLPDPIINPTLLRGNGTNFEGPDFEVGGTINLPSVKGRSNTAEIAEIRGAEEILLKKPFRTQEALQQLTGRNDITADGGFLGSDLQVHSSFRGSKFKIAPHVDQTQVYNAVFDTLTQGGCVGIFPEGGSHDRPDLLPLKAGVALMALGAVAANPDCDVTIIPCGMNYFHAHKFRSRAVIEFGNPVKVPPELVRMYKEGQKRESVGALLDTIYQALVAVTVTCPDYESLMVIQAARRLYNPTGKKLPLPVVVELNRRLAKGYAQYKDDPRIIQLKASVMDYNKQLWLLGIRDHQVQYAKFSIFKVVATLVYRAVKLGVMALGTLPGFILFAPVFVATKLISIKKSREALAASNVKIQGRDVMATWKLLVALAFAPLLYTFYTAVLTYWTYRHRVWNYVPEWVPLWSVVLFGFWIFPSITFAALRIGEVGMDILKSLRPLLLSLNPTSANTLVKLRARRAELSLQVTELINTLGPEMFPDFDSARIVVDPFKENVSETGNQPEFHDIIDGSFVSPRGAIERLASDSSMQDQLPRNESFHDLASFGFFSTRPSSRTRSRSNSNGGLVKSAGLPLKEFSTLDSKASLEEVTKRIRGAMRERGRERRQRSEDSTKWELGSSGSQSPVLQDKKDL
ncbi:hypothetical protein FQN57_002288 [Myotisia sp. PD_48]|nr:hypothetical protein FQN57_002288 [Myotisia sp. PD_48]